MNHRYNPPRNACTPLYRLVTWLASHSGGGYCLHVMKLLRADLRYLVSLLLNRYPVGGGSFLNLDGSSTGGRGRNWMFRRLGKGQKENYGDTKHKAETRKRTASVPNAM